MCYGQEEPRLLGLAQANNPFFYCLDQIWVHLQASQIVIVTALIPAAWKPAFLDIAHSVLQL